MRAHAGGGARPAVSVVMPFAGDREAALRALDALAVLALAEGDERILVDNCGALRGRACAAPPGVLVVGAERERSPAYARNAGAARACGEWILFLDADTRPPAELLERYFERPVGPEVGALAGEIRAAAGPRTLAARYAGARAFLSLGTHLAHPYRPRAAAANLLVRRCAFDALGGFFEGLRAAEDTDFCWRLQAAGWLLRPRPEAIVEHRYRGSLRELRSQWRAYAAGRAWLGRRYPEFTPEPAAARALRRLRAAPRPAAVTVSPTGARAAAPRLARLLFLSVDLLLAGEELAGLLLSNRPPGRGGPAAAARVLVATRFPDASAPRVCVPGAAGRGGSAAVRVEAGARPERIDPEAARALAISYREDDGSLDRALALARLLLAHPLRSAQDRLTRRAGEVPLRELAPVVQRLGQAPAERVLALDRDAAEVARRLERLQQARRRPPGQDPGS